MKNLIVSVAGEKQKKTYYFTYKEVGDIKTSGIFFLLLGEKLLA